MASTVGAVDFTATPNAAITDNTYNGTLGTMLSSVIDTSSLPALSVVGSISIDIDLTHTWVGDLVIKLQSPDGSILGIMSRPGVAETTDDGNDTNGFGDSSNWNVSLRFSDAGTGSAEQMGRSPVDLSTSEVIGVDRGTSAHYTAAPGSIAGSLANFAGFNGLNAVGNWTLYIGDAGAADIGTLRSWTLPITAAPPALAATHWLGQTDSTWSGTNWASDSTGTATTATPTATDDITFAATGAANQVNTNLDADFTINSLTVNSATGISTAGTQSLTVNTITTLNSLLAVNSGVTLVGNGDVTTVTTGTLAGTGAVQMAVNQSIANNGVISVGDPSVAAAASTLSLTTSGTGAVVMGAGSTLLVDLFTGAAVGDNTGIATSSDRLSLTGTLNATAGGTLVISNPNALTGFAGGDQWLLIDLNGGAGAVTGTLAVDDSSLALATGFAGSFDQTTGIYSITDSRPQMTAMSSGLPMANAMGQMLTGANQTVTGDVNNHLFNLIAGDGEADAQGSIGASMDLGVVLGEGDGPESPVARVSDAYRWKVFTTVNYGYAKLDAINAQAGVQVDSWAPSIGIERHLARGIAVGFATSFLSSRQSYTGGLGSLDLEGPALSAYLTYVRKNFWNSLLYSFGTYELDSTRNPGLGFPTAFGTTRTYTNSVQYNTGWNFRFQNNTLVTGPFAGIDWLHGSVDSYSETGGGAAALRYNEQSYESLVTRVGWAASKKIHTDWADITPQVRVSYERQNLKNNGTSVSLLNAPFTAAGGNQTPGQDYVVAGAGVNVAFNDRLNLLLTYQGQFFRSDMQAHFGGVRFSYSF